MSNTIIDALADNASQKSYLMTTVTTGCVVVRNPSAESETAISLSRVSEIKTVKASYPGLLVIASGLSVVAAAAFCSKEGDGAGFPTAFLGASFVAGYFLSRKAALKFIVDCEVTQTPFGSPRAARNLRAAVQTARTQEANPEQQVSEQPDLELNRSLSGLLSLNAEGANS
ncbi:MAG: hypothetical protein ACJ74Y_06815 [Bryobacteraceae bacterium]